METGEEIQKVLDKEKDRERREKCIEAHAKTMSMIMLITRLRTYGLRKKKNNFKDLGRRGWDTKEIREAYYDLGTKERQNREAKGRSQEEEKKGKEEEERLIQRVTQAIRREEKKQQERLFRDKRETTTMRMLKKYGMNKRAVKAPWPQKIKAEGQMYPPIKGIERYYLSIMGEMKEGAELENPIERTRETVEGHGVLVTKPGIRKVLIKLERGKSPGSSGVPADFYKDGGEPMVTVLQEWLGLYEKEKYIPSIMKVDIKKPLPKYGPQASKEERARAENYRPIALQCASMKIMDGLIKNRIELLDKENEYISINQGGFKKEEGSLENLYALQEVFDRNEKLAVAFLDLSKAYDTVWREALLEMLDKTYGMPKELIKMISAMYTQTRSVIQINGTLGEAYQTHRGLLQGALTSPILFNLYINGLIKKLNQKRAGGHLNQTTKINNLFFADDICLISRDIQGLRALLAECSRYADKWRLRFNNKKCKVVMKGADMEKALWVAIEEKEGNQQKQTIKIGGGKIRMQPAGKQVRRKKKKIRKPLRLQGKEIGELEKGTYKYLGLPVGKYGIETQVYVKQPQRKMWAATAIGVQYCEDNNLGLEHRLTVYKATMRSVMEYGAAIVPYSPEEIACLERAQQRALKRILGMDDRCNYQTILGVHELSSMEQRIRRMVINFWLKIRKANSNRSIANKIATIGMQDHTDWQQRMKGGVRIGANSVRSPLIARAYEQAKIVGLRLQAEMEEQQDKVKQQRRIRQHFKRVEKEEMMQIWKKQRTGFIRMNMETLMYQPTKETLEGTIGPLERAGKDLARLKWEPNWSYIPAKGAEWKLRMSQMLCKLDNGREWWRKETCKHCKMKTSHIEIHNLVECREESRERRRKAIFKSIRMEVEEFIKQKEKWVNWDKIDKDFKDIIDDGEVMGWMSKEEGRRVIAFLLGAKELSIDCHENDRKPLRDILYSHLVQLKLLEEEIRKPDKWEEIRKGKRVAREDIKKGRIICRTQEEGGEMIQENIREELDLITTKYATAYNLSFGAASSRSALNKIRAGEYTKRIIDTAKGRIVYVDGSIHTIEEEGGKKERGGNPEGKRQCGGYGIQIGQEGKDWIMGQVETDDAQRAEMTGVGQAIEELIERSKRKKEGEGGQNREEIQEDETTARIGEEEPNKDTTSYYTILCDCKNVVNYINGVNKTGFKYAPQIQRIKARRKKLYRQGIVAEIKWIPGHCDIRGNDKVDALAKMAARKWDKTSEGREKYIEAKKEINMEPRERATIWSRQYSRLYPEDEE